MTMLWLAFYLPHALGLSMREWYGLPYLMTFLLLIAVEIGVYLWIASRLEQRAYQRKIVRAEQAARERKKP